MGKRSILLMMCLLLGAGWVMAQKSKIKGDSLVSDSARAAAAREAALRGGNVMKADRDSLRMATKVSTVKDTFAMAPAHDPAFSPVSKEDFDAARKRVAEARADLDKAAKALAAASASGKYSDAALEALALRISAQTERIAVLTARLEGIEGDWKADRVGGNAGVVKVDSVGKGSAPAGGGGGSGKGAVKGTQK